MSLFCMDSYLFSSLYGSRTYVIGDNVDRDASFDLKIIKEG